MKKIKRIIYILGLLLLSTTACEDFLDQAPEAGISEDAVFSKYANFKSFFDRVYEGTTKIGDNWRGFNIKTAYPLYFNYWDQKYSWEALTDFVDQGRLMESQPIKSGVFPEGYLTKYVDDGGRRPIFRSMWEAIRISNICINKIDEIQDAKPDEILDLKAQAYFVRAFAHMELFRIWGPMPYLTEVLEATDDSDLPRLSKWETCTKISQDFDTAATIFAQATDIPLMRRDNPVQGQPGYLEHPDIWRPNGCTALAFKGRVLLWRASPLNNQNGAQDWEEAAAANWQAIKTATQHGYSLLPMSDYEKNYSAARNTNESLWSWYSGDKSYNNGDLAGMQNGIFAENKSSFSGSCPTQNAVDRFETKWGDPLLSEAERQEAIASGHYQTQDPYKDRDPRFYKDIIYNQANIPGYNKANIFFDNATGKYSELLNPDYAGRSRTGYYERKRWGGQSVKNKITPMMTDPLMRLAELYLNYAEAANQAWGPSGMAPGAELTALQAINIVRARAGMPDVLEKFTGSTEALASRIQNERIVELCFEGQYYYDIRRWMIAPITMTTPLMGMKVEKLAAGYDATLYPTGFKYIREPLPADRQATWKDAMYYFPFVSTDMFKMKDFTPNPSW